MILRKLSKNIRLQTNLEVRRGPDGESFAILPVGEVQADKIIIPGNTEFEISFMSDQVYLSSPSVRPGKLLEFPPMEKSDLLRILSGVSIDNGKVRGKYYLTWAGGPGSGSVLIPTDSREGRGALQEYVYMMYVKGSGPELFGPGPGIPGNRYYTGERAVVYIGRATGVDGKPTYAYVYESDIPEGTKTLSGLIQGIDGAIIHSGGIRQKPTRETPVGSVWVRFSRVASRLIDLGNALIPDLGSDWPSDLVDRVVDHEVQADLSEVSRGWLRGSLVAAAMVLGLTEYKGQCRDRLREKVMAEIYWDLVKGFPTLQNFGSFLESSNSVRMEKIKWALELNLKYFTLLSSPGLSKVDLKNVFVQNLLGQTKPGICDVIKGMVTRTDLSDRGTRQWFIKECLKVRGEYLWFRTARIVYPQDPANSDLVVLPVDALAETIVSKVLADASGDPETWVPRLKAAKGRTGDGYVYLRFDSLELCQWYPSLMDEVWEKGLLMVQVKVQDLALLPSDVYNV